MVRQLWRATLKSDNKRGWVAVEETALSLHLGEQVEFLRNYDSQSI